MSSNYEKYKAMSPEQLQEAVDSRKVTTEYLSWLGITGSGKVLKNTIKELPA